MVTLIRSAIERPVAVLAFIAGIIMFGYLALTTIPIQMSPDIEKPIYQVRVSWPGAAPVDVDREIVSRLEQELSNLSQIEEVSSSSSTGSARVTLTYTLGTDMDKALTVLLSKLAGITGLPDESRAPQVRTSNSDDSPIARMALVSALGNDQPVDIENLGDFVRSQVVDPLSRINGVAEVTFNGGGAKQMRIIVDEDKLAAYQLTAQDVFSSLRNATTLRTVGRINEGKRTYVVRAEAISYTPETAMKIVVRSATADNGLFVPVLLSDVATVEFDVERRESFRRLNGQDAVIINALREQGSNVVATMDIMRSKVSDLNEGVLASNGLRLNIVYDETGYISSAIDLVQQNIWIGGLLALTILLLFLRSFLPTVAIFIAIPVSVIGTFVAIAGLGLSINVISLAGLAFAVGMVVDASIVSMENIFRLRQSGLAAPEAAYHGARQVWAPILGSALTTVIVFIPVILLDLPVGQLFRDIGIAISVSVLISVFVSVTVIPALSSYLLRGDSDRFSKPLRLPVIDPIAALFARAIVRYASLAVRAKTIGLVMVAVLMLLSIGTAVRFMPKLDYLPDGNANFLLARILVPPGYSIEEAARISQKMEAAAKPLWEKEELGGKQPKIDKFFFVAFNGGGFAGATAADPNRVTELRPVLMRPVFSEPGARAFVFQASLFGRSVGGSRSIALDLTGPSIENLQPVAQRLTDLLDTQFPQDNGNQLRIIPSLDSGTPQIQIAPQADMLARIGMTASEFATAIDIFNDGIAVTEVPINGELVDLVLEGRNAGELSLSDLNALPIVTRSGDVMRADQIADIQIVSAEQSIRRLGGKQALTVRLRPEESIALEDAIAKIETAILPELTDFAKDKQVSVSVSGAASALAETWAAMQANVVTAIGVIFLLLVVLLRSFILPLIIIAAVPVAAAGGIIGLYIINLFLRQSLDMLTMLGFVILTGIVVNNAILMVEQTVLQIKEDGMSVDDAIIEATRNRIRPIFMSTLTSLFGLVPLVVFPGAGSELYRGIGTVVFGGLALSTIATLFIVPPLLSVFRASVVKAAHHKKVDVTLSA
ncbi:MAG: efflux RND transporter permease subunit [Candidatus Puniceispirillaceae bacterium]